MRTSFLIIIAGLIILSSVVFAVSQPVSQDLNQSKRCDIPYDGNFIKSRSISSSSDGTPHYSIDEEFSIFSTVPIGEFAVDESAHSLILKPVVSSYGYIIMCDPLPVLEKRFEAKLHGLFVLVDGEEIEPDLVNDVLRIDVNDNTRIEIIGFTFV